MVGLQYANHINALFEAVEPSDFAGLNRAQIVCLKRALLRNRRERHQENTGEANISTLLHWMLRYRRWFAIVEPALQAVARQAGRMVRRLRPCSPSTPPGARKVA
ncbi:hypothetical protein BN77_3538 [Rhizobium mesoamericanum STM3625]|uniref:Transposase n=1 Tax=Rhizobium mesoamericanum STM3625 TaxID=1211777 RepID=K0PXR9_9HYPH|nr:hypothetical protein BN77_3538 [Rhizobium mesoamericanum STM3625]